MKRSSIVVFALLIVFILASFVSAAEKNNVIGEKLVREFWKNMKSRNIEVLEKMMADGFQSIHQDGPRTKEQELSLIKKLDLGKYTLANFKTTQNGDVVIVTYTVSVTREDIDGKLMPTTPAQRMTIFIKTKKGYKILAHANLEAMNK